MKVQKRIVLQQVDPSRNMSKFYEINLCLEDKNGPWERKYSVIARWGRIESFESDSTQRQTKVSGASLAHAESVYESYTEQKRRKGYKVYRDYDFRGQYTDEDLKPAPKAEGWRQKEKTPSKTVIIEDRTAMLEVPVESHWWADTGRLADVDRDL